VGAGDVRAWLYAAFAALCALAGLVLHLLYPGAGSFGTFTVVLETLMLIGIAGTGGLVASRLPRNPSGWLILTIGASFALVILTDRVYEAQLRSGPAEGIGLLAPWLESWIWMPAMVSVAVFPQLFPTGRPLPGRWRLLLRTAAAAGPLMFVGIALADGPLNDYPEVDNPVGVGGGVFDVLGWLGFVLFALTVLGAVASLVVRWRRSAGVERQQLKWVATAAVSFPVAFVMPTDETAGDELGFALLMLSLFLIAGAVAIAILRYRLYDIDVVIRRTLVYAALTITLVGTYLAIVLLAQLVLPERSDLGVAISTLAAAAVFTPARRRIQSAVDRRFFRSRFDAQRTLMAFGTRMRDELDLDALSGELQEVVGQTMQPAHVSLWLRPT
jgi:hypothetical protein